MSDVPNKTIGDLTGLSYVQINKIIEFEGLAKQKAEHAKVLESQFTQHKANYMKTIAGLSLDLIIRGLKERAESAKPLNIPEVKMISDVFAQLDKIIKLDTGQATEHIQHVSVTIEDIKDALTKDKFIDVMIENKGDNNETDSK